MAEIQLLKLVEKRLRPLVELEEKYIMMLILEE